MLKVLDLFAGIGGFALASEKEGLQTKQFVEISPRAQAVLKKNFPSVPVPIHGDIRTYIPDQSFDVISATFPCTNTSVAGDRKGIVDGDQSSLFFEVIRIIKDVRPKFVVFENPTGLLDCGMGRLLREVSEIGYDAEWQCISGPSIGSPTRRERVIIICYPSDSSFCRGKNRAKCWADTIREEISQVRANSHFPSIVGASDGAYSWVSDQLDTPGVEKRTQKHRMQSRVLIGKTLIPQYAQVAIKRIKYLNSFLVDAENKQETKLESAMPAAIPLWVIASEEEMNLSFSITTQRAEKLGVPDPLKTGVKTVSRRDWTDKHAQKWINNFNNGNKVHLAWSKLPMAKGAKKLGTFELVCAPYKEKLSDISLEDTVAEGGFWDTPQDYINEFSKGNPDREVWVIRWKNFRPIESLVDPRLECAKEEQHETTEVLVIGNHKAEEAENMFTFPGLIEIESQQKEVDQRIQELTKEYDRLEVEKQGMVKLNEEAIACVSNIEETKAQLDALNVSQEDVEAWGRNILHVLGMSHLIRSEMTDALKSANEENDRLLADIEDMKDEIASLKEENADLAMSANSGEETTLDQVVSSMREEMAENLATVNKENDFLRSEIARLQGENQILEDANQELNDQMQDLVKCAEHNRAFQVGDNVMEKSTSLVGSIADITDEGIEVFFHGEHNQTKTLNLDAIEFYNPKKFEILEQVVVNETQEIGTIRDLWEGDDGVMLAEVSIKENTLFAMRNEYRFDELTAISK